MSYQYCTQPSKHILDTITIRSKTTIGKPSIRVLDNMIAAFATSTNNGIHPCFIENIDNIRQQLVQFDRILNTQSVSKFQKDVYAMDSCTSFLLVTTNGTIYVHFLHNTADNTKIIACIISAILCFVTMIPFEYNNMVIYVALDDNMRILPTSLSYDDAIKYVKKNSSAFNVSGVTMRHEKKIVLTKKENIIKLLFHELAHYACLEQSLHYLDAQYGWATSEPVFNLSEAYAEYLSIVLHTSYCSIMIASNSDTDVYDVYSEIMQTEKTYSIQLSSNILAFYGYTTDTVHDFFQGIGKKHACPIAIWEYILIRTQLLLNVDDVLLLTPDLYVNPDIVSKIIKYMSIPESSINMIARKIPGKPVSMIPYCAVDLNYDLF